MREKSEKKLLQRILILASGLAFFGSSAGVLVGMLVTPQQQESTSARATSIEEELQSKESGYELVLEREPDNSMALQGLVQTRLELRDFQGAIEPLEKLVKLYPREERLSDLLREIKKQADINKK